MKKSLLSLALGLAAGLAGASAFANTGTINFEGAITGGGTCPIEIVNPIDGSMGGLVRMINVSASAFTAAGQEHGGKPFVLRIADGAACNIAVGGGKANITFNGAADTSGSYFAVRPIGGAATNVAISLKQPNGTNIGPGTPSATYDVAETGPTEFRFHAFYRSLTASVTPGTASADVTFLVDII